MPKSGTLAEAHIIDAVAEVNGYARDESFEIFEILLELVKDVPESGENVMDSGFGWFCVKEKAKRRGGNPATGKNLIIAARKVITSKWPGKLN